MNKIPLIILTTMLLTNCAGYGSSFTCPDAKGLMCGSVDSVDQMIDSGQIIEVEGCGKCNTKSPR